MKPHEPLKKLLANFAERVHEVFALPVAGEPEGQLTGPVDRLFREYGDALSVHIACKRESWVAGQSVKPDYAVTYNGLLRGYIELKAPGTGANVNSFRGHNRNQWHRIKMLPNVLYTDGNEWALYRSGEREGSLVRLSGDITQAGKEAITDSDAQKLHALFIRFLDWRPEVPKTAGELAQMIAPLCRILRDEVVDALSAKQSVLARLAEDWRSLLFPKATDAEFADAYAQTLTFALLLARSEGASISSLQDAEAALASEHNLLAGALSVLVPQQELESEIGLSLGLMLRVVDAIPPETLTGKRDPWIHFYERFLAVYDPKLRRDAGAYYTPAEVVQAQVRMVDDILRSEIGLHDGFLNEKVVTLDPALGTGTYLLGIIEHALESARSRYGEGAVDAHATSLSKRLYGFENMVGPYSVAHLRVTRALESYGASLPDDGPAIYLTDTLESPYARPADTPLIVETVAEQHKKALEVKQKEPILVCIGNPPYDRHTGGEEARQRGGWVRHGAAEVTGGAPLDAFVEPVKAAGWGVDLKNIYNLYVYFWRWALWKVFEQAIAPGPGVVSFITASSYLDGTAFAGMRKHMRMLCDEIWILDLGGEGRGTRQDDNVFDIQTPVAIAVAVRRETGNRNTPARVHYARFSGSRVEKRDELKSICSCRDISWQECPTDELASFKPAGTGAFFEWPLLTDIFPWQHTGSEVKRTWPISPSKEVLRKRWRALLGTQDKATLFGETRDRKVNKSCKAVFKKGRRPPLSKLRADEDVPDIKPYGYRSFDRQYILADSRLADYLRPVLWHTAGPKQVYLTMLSSTPIDRGPALTATENVPDRHHFRGSYGGKDVIPLFRDIAGTDPNVASGVLRYAAELGEGFSAEDVCCYVYALLANSYYSEHFRKQLGSKQIRVPLTRDAHLFAEAAGIGAELLWLHTHAKRFVPDDQVAGEIPRGTAECLVGVPQTEEGYPREYSYDEDAGILSVGKGRFSPVAPAVFDFEVSGLKPVQSWLDYRIRGGAGRQTSDLHSIEPMVWSARFTNDLLDLLWVLEQTLALYPQQEKILHHVLDGPLVSSTDLPEVGPEDRKPPSSRPPGLSNGYQIALI